MKQLLIVFAVLAIGVASAETFHVTLFQSTVVKGTELKAGDYKLDLQTNQVVIQNGKTKLEVPVTVDKAEKKFNNTAVRYSEDRGKYSLREIELGGTKTKLVFESMAQTGGGQ